MTRRRLKKPIRIAIIVIITILVILVSTLFIYNLMLSKVNSNEDIIEFEVESGVGINTIIERLKNDNLIKNALVSKIYVKLNNINSLQAGTYELSRTYSTKKIIYMIHSGKVSNKNEIDITFKEGVNIRKIAKVIAENTNNSEGDVFDLLKDSDFINAVINKYWFITDEIKKQDIYYPLEGYLFPDTYRFANKDVSVKEIFNKMLNQMDMVLTQYKTHIESSDFTVHEFLTLSSIVQLEGINDEDSAKISSVFHNRLNKRMPFQSCATACYALKYDGACLPSVVPINYKNPYNTYTSAIVFPIGPISSPGLSAIKATANPDKNEYLFFVSDKNKVTYFTKSVQEHEAKIKELKNKKLWLE